MLSSKFFYYKLIIMQMLTTFMRKTGHAATALCLAVGLAGCAGNPEVFSASEMLTQAIQAEDNADYETAQQLYNDIQANHPYGPYAQQSLLNLGHLHFANREFSEAIAVLDRFMRQYPSHNNIDYARYLRGVSLQHDRPDLLDQLIIAQSGTNSRRDLVRAYDAYQELIRLHPDSVYVPDAIERANEIVNLVAESELKTAIHYMRLGAYSAAVQRSTKVMANYPDTATVEVAIAIMVASLTEMGSQAPLDDAIESLRISFPNSALLGSAIAGVDTLLDHLGVEKKPGTYFTSLIE